MDIELHNGDRSKLGNKEFHTAEAKTQSRVKLVELRWFKLLRDNERIVGQLPTPKGSGLELKEARVRELTRRPKERKRVSW